MTPLSAPQPCPDCGDLVRRVLDVHRGGELHIDAAQAGADRGTVVVVEIAPPAWLWLVAVYDTPGPPEPLAQWDTHVPPALFAVHVCAGVPAGWPAASTAAAAGAELEAASS
jgi:hypothetical protein